MKPPSAPGKSDAGSTSAAFPLVGIGASAGGLAALQRLLPGLPAKPGFAIVIVLHLAPDQPSLCHETLQRFSNMPVQQVTRHPTELLVDHIYVIAPGTLLKVEDRYLFLDRASDGRTTLGAIDYFLHSLALSHRQRAIGILLSGMGQDGCGGMAALREQGGTAIVQLPQDAEYAPLPQAAIAAGQADMVLPAAAIGPRLLLLCRVAGEPAVLDGRAAEAQALQDVLGILHDSTGHDFRHYKRPGILRRLERRLHLHGMRSLAAYRALMQQDGDEAGKLLQDLLIGVTGFFRDRYAFEHLRTSVLPLLMHSCAEGELRLWVAACSTGQEAYSLAMLLSDLARNMPDAPAIRIFASDIDEQALSVARAGLYPESIRDEVPAAALERYFVRIGKQYRVRQSLRAQITFASHNLLRDPPFSGLDLVSCRNFMIYLDRSMQRHVLQRFHFGLRRGGYLFLGSADTADNVPELFGQVDRTNRIYQARVLPARRTVPLAAAPYAPRSSAAPGPAGRPVQGTGTGAPAPPSNTLDDMRALLAESESGREQLQSNNEELATINAELKARLQDIGAADDDLNNLIASVDLPTLFVDPALVIKRYTPRAAGIFNLIPRDVGRSLLDITHRLDYPELEQDVARTFDTLQPFEREVGGSDGRRYLVRLRPYRTSDDVIVGAVLTLFDSSARGSRDAPAGGAGDEREFLLHLGDSLRPLADPRQLLALGCRMLGERLALAQLAYAPIRAGRFELLPGHAADAAPLQGSGRVDALDAAVLERWAAGQVALTDDRAGALAALAGDSRALLSCVVRQGERWQGFFLAASAAARQWTAPELTLFMEAAGRIGVEFERARAQAALHASAARLSALLHGAAQMSWESDADGAGNELWLDTVHPDDRASASGMWRDAVRNCAAGDIAIRKLDPGGGWHYASVLATPLLDECGQVRRWHGCLIDDGERNGAPSGSI